MTWIKYKHFLFFGLGGPLVNTLVWFALRLQDQSANLGGGDSNDTQAYFAKEEEEHLYRGDIKEHGHNNDTSSGGFSKWEDRDKPLVCLFVEDKQMDVWVMQVVNIIDIYNMKHMTFLTFDILTFLTFEDKQMDMWVMQVVTLLMFLL